MSDYLPRQTMTDVTTSLQLTLPDWLRDATEDDRLYGDDDSRVALAIDLARRNVENATGGPFGAAVFSVEGRLVSVGVNRVLPQNCSVAHAGVVLHAVHVEMTGETARGLVQTGDAYREVVQARELAVAAHANHQRDIEACELHIVFATRKRAYMLAQARVQRSRLNENGERFVLATSAQPCCQCYGATFWAGIDELLIGARSEDVEELTEFDEGPLPPNWIGELEARGIAVRRDILREAARGVFLRYRELGGQRY